MGGPKNDSYVEPILDPSILARMLGGVAIATKALAQEVKKSEKWFYQIAEDTKSSYRPERHGYKGPPLALRFWLSALPKRLLEDDVALGLATLTIAVTSLREFSRLQIPMDQSNLDSLWQRIFEVLNIPGLQETWTASRSAQGFLAVPLCSITMDGKIDELIRLHVWLPDGKRGNPDFFVHSHQPFAQSWILAGEGIDHQYEALPAGDAANATHEAFTLSWTASKGLSKAYSTHQQSSVVEPTGNLFHVKETESNTHHRNDTYIIPAAAFHSSQVSPYILHATLFYFDSSRGFIRDAPVLGPVHGPPFTQLRDPVGETPKSLAYYVNIIRTWEFRMEEGRQFSRNAEWEHAMRAFNSALSLCGPTDIPLDMKRYRGLVLGELGNTNRRFGRYEASQRLLKQACLALEGSPEYATFQGELGVVYRHMDRLQESKEAFQSQYTIARHFELDSEACRAIGNLGMVNYQLAEMCQSDELLKLAIEQLQERVDLCKRFRRSIMDTDSSSISAARRLKQLDVWAAIGLARLSLCWTSMKKLEKAHEAAEAALGHAMNNGDPTVVAISRFFYGRVLVMENRRNEALQQFNDHDLCTPAIAFCKEPSKEHRGYLEYLVNIGADMDLTDNQGYKALDYTVFSGDEVCRDLVLKGLRCQFKSEPNVEDLLQQRSREAILRKGYREMFQEKLRPVLLKGGVDCLTELRVAYANALTEDKDKLEMFDHFKVVPYMDLLRLQRLPRSSDGLCREFGSRKLATKQYVIFFSYRWLNPMAHINGGSPDNENGTQYRRMLQAIEDFLESHGDIQPENLQIWLDHACVNQDNPSSGVAALPMILAQCDAVISLIDDQYYDRAWCSIESTMIRILKDSYGIHEWYEQPIEGNVSGVAAEATRDYGMLRDGPMELDIPIIEKKLSFEGDRPRILFLERQSKLLG